MPESEGGDVLGSDANKESSKYSGIKMNNMFLQYF